MEDRANILRQMKVCRFCLSSEEQELSNIHDKNATDSSLPLPVLPIQIMACIAIEVVKNDNMPQYICKSCRHLTSQAYIFKTNCKKADDALKLFLVTGQLSKPYMQKVVDLKVQPATEKIIEVLEEEETEKSQQFPEQDEGDVEFQVIEEEEEEEEDTETIIATPEVIKRANHSSVSQVVTRCFPCTECERSFPLKQLLDIHMSNHSRVRHFECETCHTKFYTKYDLQKHILSHNPVKDYACVVCQKTFTREPMLRRHEKIHVNVPKYVCLQCDKTFLTKEYLEFHMEKHKKKRPFTCNVCNKSFVFKQGLERHEVVHSENKPHKCNYCEASFTTAIKLTRHITTHAGLRPYPCKLCGRTFLLSHHLTRHMRSHYASTTSLDSVGQHKCDICSMSFKQNDALIKHSAIHSMVNLKCVICNTTFETASSVKDHISIHLTGLPFPCEKCDYSFETSDQLEEHELKHAEMEYEDLIEKEVFSESLTMQEHGQDQDYVHDPDQDNSEEDDEAEEGEVREYTIVDINNPEAGIRRTQESQPGTILAGPTIKFLKDEIESADEQEAEGTDEDEVEEVEVEPIKPIVRHEGTKVYQRKDTPGKSSDDVSCRLSSLNEVLVEKQQQQIRQQPEKQFQLNQATTLPDTMPGNTSQNKRVGEKVLKIQKFILTKDEMKAMAKQGILEIKNGQVVLKSGGQQILNATLKSIQKNEIDSLLDKRQAGGKFEIKKYEKKNVFGDLVTREET